MKAYTLSFNNSNILDQWDFGFLQDFLNDNDIAIIDTDTLPTTDRAIVILPARHHAGLEDKVNMEIAKIDHVVLFLMGDEEAEFEVEKIQHSSIYIWVQNPHRGRHDTYNKLGTGYPPHMLENLPETVNKTIKVNFAGQVTHQRRVELTDVLIDMSLHDDSIKLLRTKGFTQGDVPVDYYANMCASKIAPAPSGAVIPDSFRLFEALECMSIPIADQRTPDGKVTEYWDWLFGQETPFPKVDNWDRLYGLVPELLEDYPRNLHNITAWYLKWKRDFKNKVLEQVNG